MKNIKALFLGSLLLVSSSSFAGIFTLHLVGFPKEAKTCLEQGASAAQIFQNKTGLPVVHVECVAENESGYNFKWEYESEKSVSLITTDYSAWGTTPTGRYRNALDCISALPLQADLFSQATGVAPLFAYCRRQNIDVGKNWEIILIGFGETPLKPQLGGFLWFSEPQAITLTEIKASLDLKLKSLGALLADVIIHYNTVMGAGTTAIHYFAPQRIEFSLERVVQVPSQANCFQALEEAKEFLQPEEKALFITYCGKSTFGAFDLHLGFVGKPSTRIQTAAQSFSSLSECESQRAVIVKEHSGSKLARVLGGLCSKDTYSGKYTVILFKKPYE